MADDVVQLKTVQDMDVKAEIATPTKKVGLMLFPSLSASY